MIWRSQTFQYFNQVCDRSLRIDKVLAMANVECHPMEGGGGPFWKQVIWSSDVNKIIL